MWLDYDYICGRLRPGMEKSPKYTDVFDRMLLKFLFTTAIVVGTVGFEPRQAR